MFAGDYLVSGHHREFLTRGVVGDAEDGDLLTSGRRLTDS